MAELSPKQTPWYLKGGQRTFSTSFPPILGEALILFAHSIPKIEIPEANIYEYRCGSVLAAEGRTEWGRGVSGGGREHYPLLFFFFSFQCNRLERMLYFGSWKKGGLKLDRVTHCSEHTEQISLFLMCTWSSLVWPL